MIDLNYETETQLNDAIKGKTVLGFEVQEERGDTFLVFHFIDGKHLRIRYDYVYDFEIISGECGLHLMQKYILSLENKK